MNIRMARRCLNGGCQEAIQCPEGRCVLHAAMSAPAPRNEGPEECVPPKVSEKDINRWQDTIQQRPEGPWTLGCGGSFDRTTINPISDEMLAELAQWLRMGYTPWNGRSMPLSPGDRQFMFMLYYSVQGLIARMRAAEKLAAPEAAEPVAPSDAQIFALSFNGHLNTEAAIVKFGRAVLALAGNSPGQEGRDAVEARSQQFAERVREGIADFAADNWPDRKHSLAEIENGIRAIEVDAGLIRAALSTTTGRAAE